MVSLNMYYYASRPENGVRVGVYSISVKFDGKQKEFKPTEKYIGFGPYSNFLYYGYSEF